VANRVIDIFDEPFTIDGQELLIRPSVGLAVPSSVAGLIGAYQARLEQETRGGGRPSGAEGFSWASGSTAVHPPTTPSDPGNNRPQAPLRAGSGASARWPYPGPGSQAMPGSQGYPRSQGYPQPQGYGGGPASQPPYAPPRGYLPASGGPASPGPPPSVGYPPNGGPTGYPPYRMGSRGPITPLPASMATAVRLMYAGAAYALVWAIGVITVWASIVKTHPVVSAAGDHRLAAAVGMTVFVCIIDIALWLGIARACRRGKSGARVAGTALFAIHTIGVLSVLVNPQAGLGPAKVLTLIGWLIGCGAVVFLWQRPSSAFFAQAALRR
ncbi:MAG: hypothetical protein ACLQB1_13540, partial [Streptosporangiaceae bacterium]